MATSVYRAEPIGSLLRPAWLLDARKALRRGEVSAAGYKKIEDHAVADAIALQERCGLDVVNDGEQRRLSFLGSLVEATEGLTRTNALGKPWREDGGSVEQLRCRHGAKISQRFCTRLFNKCEPVFLAFCKRYSGQCRLDHRAALANRTCDQVFRKRRGHLCKNRDRSSRFSGNGHPVRISAKGSNIFLHPA